MEISVNGQIEKITGSLSELIQSRLGEKTKGVAIAVNDTVIPKKDWEQFSLQENDKVLIIKASQGG